MGQGSLTRQGSRRVQIVMANALWKKHPNSHTHMKGFNLIKIDGVGCGKTLIQKKFWFLYGNAPIKGQGSRRIQIVTGNALWKKHPNSYTHMKGFNLIKFDGIECEKPHVHKKI